MKKLLIILIIFISQFLIADLDIDIPFEPDQTGQAYSDSGNYIFEFDNFYVTNLGVTDIFSIDFVPDALPENWFVVFCYGGQCRLVGNGFAGPWDQEMISDSTMDFHSSIHVVDTAGSFNFVVSFNAPTLSETVNLNFSFATADAAESSEHTILPAIYSLQNYPNPFNPATTISYDYSNLNVKETADAEIVIYNTKGQRIRNFVCNQNSGRSSIYWNGTDNFNNKVSSGIYFYNLIINNQIVVSKKMNLIK